VFKRHFVSLLEYFWVKFRIFILILNFPAFARLSLRLRSKHKPQILIVLFDNSFQSPNGSRLAHRNLEALFGLLRDMGIEYVIVRPLFGKRIMKIKTEKIYSAEALSLKSLVDQLLGRQRYIDSTWNRLLKRIQPSLVVGQNLSPSLLGVCADMNIITAEIQHGVWFENQVEVSDLELERIGGAPDYFLTWHYSFERVVNYGRAKALTIGYPTEIIKRTQRGAASLMNKQDSPLRILVALSVGVVDSTDPFGLVRSSVDQVLKELSSHSCNIVIRPHPLSGSNPLSRFIRYRWLRGKYPAATVITAEQQGINDAISKADVVITFDGTMVIDAVLRETIVLHTGESDFLGVPEDILNSGLIDKYVSYSHMENLVSKKLVLCNLESWQFREEVLRGFVKGCL